MAAPKAEPKRLELSEVRIGLHNLDFRFPTNKPPLLFSVSTLEPLTPVSRFYTPFTPRKIQLDALVADVRPRKAVANMPNRTVPNCAQFSRSGASLQPFRLEFRISLALILSFHIFSLCNIPMARSTDQNKKKLKLFASFPWILSMKSTMHRVQSC